MLRYFYLLLGGLFILLSIKPLQAQDKRAFKKAHQKNLKQLLEPERRFLKQFEKRMEKFRLDPFIHLFDTSHFNGQTRLYFTDTFMFGHLGEVGERDTSTIKKYYIKETLSLTQIDADFYLPKEFLNFWDLKEYPSIQHFYIYQLLEEVDDWRALFFIVQTKDKKVYMGKLVFWRKKLKVFGAVG